MKTLKRMIALLGAVLCLCLPGCRKEEAKKPAPAPKVTKKELTATDVYWKMRMNSGDSRARGYTEVTEVEFASDGDVRLTSTTRRQVAQCLDPLAIHIKERVSVAGGILLAEKETELYFRKEDGKRVSYVWFKNADEWIRTVLDDDVYLSQTFILTGIGSTPGEDTKFSKKTVDGREMYVLTYTLNGIEWFGRPDDKVERELLEELEVEVSYYADAETFRQEKIVFRTKNMDGRLLKYIGADLTTGVEGSEDFIIRSYTVTYTDLEFGEVEVPDVPEKGIEKAKEAEGSTHM